MTALSPRILPATLKVPQPIEILLVEDNPGDVELTQEAFHAARIANRVRVMHDGDEALAYLVRQRPDLVLLDLNMPGRDGKNLLAAIKGDAALKDIPVIILTSSEAEDDIADCYALHANAYIVKPPNFPQLMQAVRAVEMFWLDVARLPPRQRVAP